MDRDEQCDQIIKRYYPEILRHCTCLLDYDVRGAEDCTQDVFLLLHEKKSILCFHKNIRGWLYATAENIVRNYKRKQNRSQPMDPSDMEQIVDPSSIPGNTFSSSAFDDLTDQELQLLTDYYTAKQGDRNLIAEKYGMTVGQLYKKIHILREKIRKK